MLRLPVPTLFSAVVLSFVAFLGGCAGNSGGFTSGLTTISTSGSLAAGGAATVYALNDTSSGTVIPNDLLEFPAGSGGSTTAPSGTLPLNTLIPTGVALDGTGLLYVSGDDDITGIPSVNVYAAGAASTAAPLRSFSPNAAYEPVGIAVNSAGQTYVLEGAYDLNGNVLASQIEVFAPGAVSGATAMSTITGSATQLIDPEDIAVDTTGNIYVANYQDDGASQILVFPAGANGSVAPSQVIAINGEITGLAVDSSANMYAAEISSTGAASVVEYATGASGTPTAIKTISGVTSGLSAAETGAVRVDATGNIWLIQQSPDTSETPGTYLEAWPPSANGNVAPAVEFAPPSLQNPNAAFAIR